MKISRIRKRLRKRLRKWGVSAHLASLLFLFRSRFSALLKEIPHLLERLRKWGVYAPLAGLLFLVRIRFVIVTNPARIGHLCIEPECYLKERNLRLVDGFFGIFLIPEDIVANRTLLGLWARRLPIITSRNCCNLLWPFTEFRFLMYPLERYATAINETAACAGILAKWTGDPLLTLTDDMLNEGTKVLREFGIPPGAWYVCIHSREGGYAPNDEITHSFRNSDISSYRLAMQAIVENGGWCIRVGEPSVKPAPPMKGVVDYARSTSKSDLMDVFLCANCTFFLGNSSGLHLVASVFGVPSALANLIPVSSSLPVVPDGIGIPKVVKRRDTGERLTYTAIMGSAVGNFRYAEQYADAGLLVEENTAEDIRDLALEMLDRCHGRAVYAPEDEKLQARFKALFRDGHYSLGAASRIGREFLRKYERFI